MSKIRRLAVPAIGILTIVDLILALAFAHRERYSSVAWSDFLWTVWDGISLWSGRIVTIAGVVVPAAIYLRNKRWPVERTWKERFAVVLGALPAWRRRTSAVFTVLGMLVVACVALTLLLLAEQRRFAQSASPVLMTPSGAELYLITQGSQQRGQVIRVDATTGKGTLGVIDVGGTPDRMLAGPRTGYVYVLDVQRALVTVIDDKHSVREVIPSKGKIATSIALTPDERKLYISNQQPSPLATVTVVDLVTKGHPSRSIGGFNCPMGLGMLPDGSKLYVASQCGSGRDPVFVVDTTTDAIVRTVEGFAVGSEIAVAGKAPRVYVRRSSFWNPTPQGGVTEPARISVIDPARDAPVDADTISGDGSALGVSRDGQYFFFSTATTVEILNTATRKTRSIPVGSPAAGIAIGQPDPTRPDLALYAWLPQAPQLFFTGLNGLLP